MNRYFVSYNPYQKAYLLAGDSSHEIQEFIIGLLNMDFWTEVTWLEYWLYRIFE